MGMIAPLVFPLLLPGGSWGRRGQTNTRLNMRFLTGSIVFPCRALVNNPILFHEV